MPNLIIEVKDLQKTYATFKKDAGFAGALKSFFHRKTVLVPAVKPTSFKISKGEFIGLLGPNGAGKTTMLKMMTGLIPPSAGSVIAFEAFDASKRPKDYLRRIGMVMGQRNQLHPDLPAIDSFRLSQAIYDIHDDKFARRISESMRLFDIEGKLNIPVRKLSLGERMKMELILAILHEPELLFLDEPTIGLDFNAAKQIRSFLAEANKKFGITIILTSHYTKDIEELCRRVILINDGNVVYDGELTGLDQRVQGERQFTIETTDDASKDRLIQWITNTKGLTLLGDNMKTSSIVSFASANQHVGETMMSVLQSVPPSSIRDLSVQERSLEDIFAEIYNQKPVAKPSIGDVHS